MENSNQKMKGLIQQMYERSTNSRMHKDLLRSNLNQMMNQLKEMETKTKIPAVLVDGRVLKTGDSVKFKWRDYRNSVTHTGVLIITRNECFMLQNERDGSRPLRFSDPEVNRGFKYAWSFTPGVNYSDIQLVVDDIEPLIPEESNDDVTISVNRRIVDDHGSIVLETNTVYDYSENLNKIMEQYYIIRDNRNGGRGKKSSTTLCHVKGHPDCCGATILYGFSSAKKDQADYSNYKDLTDDDYENIKDKLSLGRGSAKIVHLAEYQYWAMKFVEKLGFKKIHSYTNRNSSRVITIYHYD